MGDWRLLFLHRDRVTKVTVKDVMRVAEAYLKQTNRVTGMNRFRIEMLQAIEIDSRSDDHFLGAAPISPRRECAGQVKAVVAPARAEVSRDGCL